MERALLRWERALLRVKRWNLVKHKVLKRALLRRSVPYYGGACPITVGRALLRWERALLRWKGRSITAKKSRKTKEILPKLKKILEKINKKTKKSIKCIKFNKKI